MPRGRSRTWNDDGLVAAVLASTSFAGVARLLGLATDSGSASRLKRRVFELGLDTSHFSRADQMAGCRTRHATEVWTVARIFTVRSDATRKRVREYLKAHELIPCVCFACGNRGWHNGRRLVLQLDHINGVRDDHRLENLRWACPNCHSQTETFTGRNKRASPRPARGCAWGGDLFTPSRRQRHCTVRCAARARADRRTRPETRELPRLGSNQESSDPKSDVLPITPRGSTGAET